MLTAFCGLAPLLNPYGIGLASYVGDTILFNGGGTAVGVLGVEWGAPAIRTAYGGLFYGSVVLTILLLGAGRCPRLGEGLLLLGFGLLALSSIRHILWWSLILAPFVARGLAELAARPAWPAGFHNQPQLPGRLPLLNVGVPGRCSARWCFAALPWWRERLPLPPARTVPSGARTRRSRVAEYLAANPLDGRLFNDTDWSAYFSWRLAP